MVILLSMKKPLASNPEQELKLTYCLDFPMLTVSWKSRIHNRALLVRNPALYPSKNVIVESLRTIIDDDTESPSIFEKKSEYEILDENGQEITPDELADRYLSSSELYFGRAFE